ncbi:CAP domain-containing protein [Levilactobacillus zymae]|uniref:CAP domain-containing protein n=1 Tax=Levilactobacillus zymae TaxID=267363 RepID=UPI0028B8E077|nr:CAP domain-containing protein [Levilactobacillus zymae]MDT6980174.1 hypothetical protein [Levilactobacillus zymae]
MRYLKITLACSALLLGVGLMGATTVQAAPTPPTTMAHKTTKKVKKAKKTKKVKKAKKLSAKAKRQKAKKKAFTKAERAQIAGYRSQAKQISNATKGMYVQKPSLKKSFNPGKLSAKYINGTVGWVNFYRQMFGLAPVKADAGWNTNAQYGAATLAAADMGLSHGLEGIQRPSFISPVDWQRGADATNNSNIGWGDVNPAGNVVGYLNEADDEGDLVPGHREWLLGGISRVGVGQAQAYNDLRVIEDGWTHPEPQTVAYPRAGGSGQPRSTMVGFLCGRLRRECA